VRLRPGDLTVRLFGSDDEAGTYEFACPHCGDPVTRPASPRIVSLLISAGVRSEIVSPPAEVLEHHSGPPINADDLIDFHMLLDQDGWLERLTEMVRGPGN
jgi:hypothetical protein